MRQPMHHGNRGDVSHLLLQWWILTGAPTQLFHFLFGLHPFLYLFTYLFQRSHWLAGKDLTISSFCSYWFTSAIGVLMWHKPIPLAVTSFEWFETNGRTISKAITPRKRFRCYAFLADVSSESKPPNMAKERPVPLPPNRKERDRDRDRDGKRGRKRERKRKAKAIIHLSAPSRVDEWIEPELHWPSAMMMPTQFSHFETNNSNKKKTSLFHCTLWFR